MAGQAGRAAAMQRVAGRRFRRHCLGWRGRLRHCGRWRGRRRRLRHCSQWHCSRWRGRRLGRSVAGARALRRRCRPVKVVGSWASRRSTWNQRWMLCGSWFKRAMGRSGRLWPWRGGCDDDGAVLGRWMRWSSSGRVSWVGAAGVMDASRFGWLGGSVVVGAGCGVAAGGRAGRAGGAGCGVAAGGAGCGVAAGGRAGRAGGAGCGVAAGGAGCGGAATGGAGGGGGGLGRRVGRCGGGGGAGGGGGPALPYWAGEARVVGFR